MKIFFIGDIVGRSGRALLKKILPSLISKEKLNWVIANAENAAGGSGLTRRVAEEIFFAGVDIITSGDHIFKKKEILEIIEDMDILRPLNYGELARGRGFLIKRKNNQEICVINLIGRVFMQPVDCPFKAVREILEEVLKKTRTVIVDIHAEATSEKLAVGYFLSGKVSAVLGTHTHIPTADERIIDGFTGYITDVGMTGAFDSILGRRKEDIIERFLTNVPSRFNLAEEDLRLQGVILDIDEERGSCLSIKRVEYKDDV